MSRIDAIVAAQIADVARPAQAGQERTQQAQTAQVQSLSQTANTPVTADAVRAAAAQLKQVVETASSRRLAFEVDDDSGTLLVQVRDLTSGEVIKQMPSEEILAMRERLDAIVGIFLDEEA